MTTRKVTVLLCLSVFATGCTSFSGNSLSGNQAASTDSMLSLLPQTSKVPNTVPIPFEQGRDEPDFYISLTQLVWEEEGTCESFPPTDDESQSDNEPDTKKSIDPKEWHKCQSCRKKSSREALFVWALGPESEDTGEEDDEEETIVTDRPDFTESSQAVGKGRFQIEMGYTYIHDGDGLDAHSYPEWLLRIGLFTDWLELRIAQNYQNERNRGGVVVPGGGTDQVILGGTDGPVSHSNGATDLFLGIRFDLTEQKGWLPASALFLQMAVPTGSDSFSNDEVMPGANLVYSWEVIPNFLAMAGSTQANRARDDSGDYFTEVAQSFSVGYSLTDKLGAYTEWFALFPVGASDASAGPAHFFNGGFTYLVNNNLQFDIRAGVGLNDRADDFFTGAGFAFKY